MPCGCALGRAHEQQRAMVRACAPVPCPVGLACWAPSTGHSTAQHSAAPHGIATISDLAKQYRPLHYTESHTDARDGQPHHPRSEIRRLGAGVERSVAHCKLPRPFLGLRSTSRRFSSWATPRHRQPRTPPIIDPGSCISTCPSLRPVSEARHARVRSDPHTCSRARGVRREGRHLRLLRTAA